MKKLCVYLSMILCLLLAASGCETKTAAVDQEPQVTETADQNDDTQQTDLEEIDDETFADDADETGDETDTDSADDQEDLGITVEEDGTYTSKDEVALYIHLYGKLPSNFITKKQAERMGWDSHDGNLEEVAPGMSIGGSRFGNYENQLPDGDYKECDIDYTGGYRGAKRIIYSDEGAIYYTDDHYASFTQLY